MTTVVLIHGLAGSPAAWDEVTPLLGEDADRILVPAVGGEVSIEAEADKVAALIGSGHGSALLVGHSMGGLIATAVAERFPELVDRLILINATPSPESRVGARSGAERIFAVPVIGPMVWRLVPDSALREGLAINFAPGTPVPSQVVADLRTTGCRTFVNSSANIDEYLAAASLKARLALLACPTDVLYGDIDQRVLPAAFAELHSEGSVTTTPIPGVGHMPPYEAPELVAQTIRQSLPR